MLLVSYVSGMLFAVASAFATTYVMFVVLRFFTGFCITGIVIISAVLSYSSLPLGSNALVISEMCTVKRDFLVPSSCGVGGHRAQEAGWSD